jgi:hypothetical protein
MQSQEKRTLRDSFTRQQEKSKPESSGLEVLSLLS